MPGIATQFVLLDLVVQRLKSSGDSAQQQIASILTSDANRPYAYLGAVGPDLLDFMPNDLSPGILGGASPFSQLWQIVFGIATGTPAAPGLVTTLAKLKQSLDQLDTIAESEDLGALKDFKNNGSVDSTMAAMKDLSTIVGNLTSVVVPIMTNISAGERPIVNVPLSSPVPPSITWDCRDFMHWKKTGQFASALVQHAQALGDDRYLAYAYGYAICYTGKLFQGTIASGRKGRTSPLPNPNSPPNQTTIGSR